MDKTTRTTEKPRPYFGITGITTNSQAQEILNVYHPSQLSSVPKRDIMIGVLVSQKTFSGQKNKYPNRYPVKDNLADIFPNHPLALNLIHYSTDDTSTLLDQLVAVTQAAGPFFHGFQLNIAWPKSKVIREYIALYPFARIVLQIGSRACDLVGNRPNWLADMVAEFYGDIVDHVLLDVSGGEGKIFDSEKFRDYIVALKTKGLPVGIGVAGGLSPETVDILEPLAEEFPDLNTDVEKGARDENDNLDLGKTTQLLKRELEIFK